MKNALLENRASGVLIDEPKFAGSIRQEPEALGDISTLADPSVVKNLVDERLVK